MKMVLMFGILLYGFQHAGALVLEVYNGSESVLLPCSFGNIPEEPTLTWTCSHLVPKTVHQQRDEEDYLIEQNQQFTGRTFMNRDALASGNFSLTLREPQLFDTGNYTCSLHNGREELKLTEVHLKVKGHHRVSILTQQIVLRSTQSSGFHRSFLQFGLLALLHPFSAPHNPLDKQPKHH